MIRLVLVLSMASVACGKVQAVDDGDAGVPDGGAPDAAVPTGPLRSNDIAKDLGGITLGQQGVLFSTKVRNIGEAALGPLALAVTGDTTEFRVDASDCEGSTLAPSGDCDVTIRFVPTTAGKHTAVVALTASNDASAKATIDITGTGLAPGALVVEPATFDFQRHAINGTASTTTFMVRNSGDTAISGLGLTVSGDNDYTMDASACGTMLSGGAACPVTMTFVPKHGGARTTSIRAKAMDLEAGAQASGVGVGTITVTKDGDGGALGTVAGDGLTCNGTTCTAEVAAASYALTASVGANARFIAWSAPCAAGAQCLVPIDAAQTAIAATFRELVTLTVTITGTVGRVDGLGVDCAGTNNTVCTNSFLKGTPVSLLQVRIAQPGIPRGWTGCDSSTGAACDLTMSASRAVSCLFTQ